MSFIKRNYKIIIAFILGGLIFSGLTVYATNYLASNVKYTNDKMVDQALDDLYSKVPNGKTTIKSNGTNIDISQYATADIAVPNTGEYTYWTKDMDVLGSTPGTYTYTCNFKPSHVIINFFKTNNDKAVGYISRAYGTNFLFKVLYDSTSLIGPATDYLVLNDNGFSINYSGTFCGASIDFVVIK